MQLIKNLFKLWTEKSLFDDKIVTGWQATLKLDQSNYYSCNILDGFFEPSKVKDKQLFEKVKQIVVPELRSKYKELRE